MGNCNPVLPRSNIKLLLLLFVKGRLIRIFSSSYLLLDFVIRSPIHSKAPPPPPRVLLGILGRGVPPGSPNLDPMSNQENLFFHTRFQTWPLKSILVFRPGGGQKTQHYMFT